MISDINNFLEDNIIQDWFFQNSTIAIQIHVFREAVWMGMVHTLAPVLMATKGLIVMVCAYFSLF